MVRMWLRWDTGRWSIWSGKVATVSWSRLSWLPGILIWRKGSERKVRDTNSHSKDNSEVLWWWWWSWHPWLSLSTQSHSRVKDWAHRLSLYAPNPWHQNWKRWVRRVKYKDRKMKGLKKARAVFPNLFLAPTAPSVWLKYPFINTNHKWFNLNSYYTGYHLTLSVNQVTQ